MCKPIGGDINMSEAEMMMMTGAHHGHGPPPVHPGSMMHHSLDGSGGHTEHSGGDGAAGAAGRKTKSDIGKDKARGSYRCGKVSHCLANIDLKYSLFCRHLFLLLRGVCLHIYVFTIPICI